MSWLWLSATIMVLTAIIHSGAGEQRLIRPLLAIDAPIAKSQLARQVLRFAWHLTSALMLICAIMMVWEGTPKNLIAISAIIWLGAGLIDALFTRGKHIGWPLLCLAGIFGLFGAYT